MRIVQICMLLIVLSLTATGQTRKRISKKVSVLVELRITQTSNWCGGARPSEDMERELRTPKPYTNYALFIRRDSNILTKPALHTLITNEKGIAKVRLSPGRYTVVNVDKKDDSTYRATREKYKLETPNTGAIDTNCYNFFMSHPDFVIHIPRNPRYRNKIVEHNYHINCNWSGAPCVDFKGPYPQ